MKNYIVKAYLETGTYYLTPELGLTTQLREKVKWPASEWNIETINKCVKEDAQKYSYTYEILEFYNENNDTNGIVVKLKRRSNEIVKEIIIAPDFIEVYNLIKEGYRVIEVSDEFHTYKEKWKEGD